MQRSPLAHTLQDVKAAEYYPDGTLKQCVLSAETPLTFPFGTVVPHYISDPQRKTLTRSIEFYPEGTVKTLVAQDITPIKTGAGTIPAEFITLYPNGALRRVLPSYAVITGFWTEQHEYDFVEPALYHLPFGDFEGKVINLTFYEQGAVKSFTIWSLERLELATPVGSIPIRIGASFYQNGALESTEPLWPLQIETPIGMIEAFDPDAEGIEGGWNSLNFWEDGRLKSLLSMGSRVTVLQNAEVIEIIEPRAVLSHFHDDAQALEPFKVSFHDDLVRFGARVDAPDDSIYNWLDYDFLIEAFDTSGFKLGCMGC